MSKEKNSSGFAVFVILAGIVILLFNMDMLKLDMFWGIIHLWPLLLIIAGLSIIFRNVRYMDVVLWLVFIGIVISYSYLNLDEKSWTIGEDTEVKAYMYEIEDIETGMIDLNIPTGSVEISANDIEQFDYSLPVNCKSHTVDTEDSHLLFKVDDDQSNDFSLYFQNRKYDLVIPTSGVWDMRIDGAVINTIIDLKDIVVNDVRVNFAVGDVKIIIDDYHQSNYDIDFAIGNVVVDIPDDANAKIYYSGAISSIDVPEGFVKKGDVYYSSNYDESADYLNIKVDLAIGNVEIE